MTAPIPQRPKRTGPFWFMLRDAEKRILESAFRTAGHAKGAARLLGITVHVYLDHAEKVGAEIDSRAFERRLARPKPKPPDVRARNLQNLRNAIDRKLQEIQKETPHAEDAAVPEAGRDPVFASK